MVTNVAFKVRAATLNCQPGHMAHGSKVEIAVLQFPAQTARNRYV